MKSGVNLNLVTRIIPKSQPLLTRHNNNAINSFWYRENSNETDEQLETFRFDYDYE